MAQYVFKSYKFLVKTWILSILLLVFFPQIVHSKPPLDVFEIRLAPQHFEASLELLKRDGILPQDFIPVYENLGEYGPHTRVAYIDRRVSGPWDLIPENGREMWWYCIVHGVHADGSFAGTTHFDFNIETGEIQSAQYSPQGEIAWLNLTPSMTLLQDPAEASLISAFANNDLRIYKSLSESGYLPPNYSQNVNRPEVIHAHKRHVDDNSPNAFTSRPGDRPANWDKVIQFGLIHNEHAEVHFFRHQITGEVSHVEVFRNCPARGDGSYRKIKVVVDRGIMKQVRIDLVKQELVQNPLRSLEIIAASQNEYRVFLQKITRAKKGVVSSTNREPHIPINYTMPTVSSVSEDQNKSALDQPTEPQISSEQRLAKALEEMNNLIPEIRLEAFKTAAMLMRQLAWVRDQFESSMANLDFYARISQEIKKHVIVQTGQLAGLLRGENGGTLNKSYETLSQEEEQWAREVQKQVEENPSFLSSQEYQEHLRMIQDLRQQRLNILKMFWSRLQKLVTENYQTNTMTRKYLGKYLEDTSQKLRVLPRTSDGTLQLDSENTKEQMLQQMARGLRQATASEGIDRMMGEAREGDDTQDRRREGEHARRWLHSPHR